MITVYDIEVPGHLRGLHVFLLVFELILIIPGIFLVLSYGYIIFIRAPQFHPHVHTVIGYIFIAYFIVTICRITVLFIYFTEAKMSFEISIIYPLSVILDGIRSAAASSILLSIPLLTLERLISTCRLKTYEKERHVLCLLFFLAICSCACCINAWLIMSGVPLFAFIIFGLSWLFINMFTFSRLVQWSQKEYNIQMNLSVQPLTVRFQLSENVRVGKILLAALRVLCVGVSLALVLVLFVTLPYKIHWATLTVYHLFEMEIAFAAVFVGLTIIKADKKYYSEFRKLLVILHPCRKKKVQPKKQVHYVFSLTGSQLVFSQEVEGTTYFENLRSQWE